MPSQQLTGGTLFHLHLPGCMTYSQFCTNLHMISPVLSHKPPAPQPRLLAEFDYSSAAKAYTFNTGHMLTGQC